MKQHPTNPGAEIRHFKSLCLQVKRLQNVPTEHPSQSPRLQRLHQQIQMKVAYLRRHVSARTLRRMVAAAGIVLAGFSVTQAQAITPNFASPVIDTFNLSTVSAYNFPELADMDGDGDLDMWVGKAYGITSYYENTGTATMPSFAAAVDTPFGLGALLTSQYAFPLMTVADLDGDNDLDLLTGDVATGNFFYFENVGTVNAPAFTQQVQNPFGLTAISYNSVADFVDLDNDGDFDLFATDYGGNLEYFENTGTATQPMFANPVKNPFGWAAGGSDYLLISVADFDNDGDQDVIGAAYSAFTFYENTGTPTMPSFAQPNASMPLNLQNSAAYLAPAEGDLDGDGDLDIVCGLSDSTFAYYENSPLVSVDDRLEFAGELAVSPNPAQSQARIQLPEAARQVPGHLRILTLQGREVYRADIPAASSELPVDVGKLASGMYQVILVADQQRYRGRFSKL